MTYKEKIHQILSSLWKNDDSVGKTYYNQALQDVQTAIDLQEEPVSEKKCMFTKDSYTDEDRKILCDGCKEKCEYNKKEEPVSEDLEEAASRYAKEEYNHKNPATLPDRCRGCYAPLMYAFKAGAKWQKEQIEEALLSEVLPCFMHGGEADEVVAKLDEVLNQKK